MRGHYGILLLRSSAHAASPLVDGRSSLLCKLHVLQAALHVLERNRVKQQAGPKLAL